MHIVEPGVSQTGLYDTFQEGLTKNWNNLDERVQATTVRHIWKLPQALTRGLKLSNKDPVDAAAMVHALHPGLSIATR